MNRSTRGSQGGVEKLSLTSDDHASLSSELEISCGGAGEDFTNKFPRGVEHPDTITRSGVDATKGIRVNTYVICERSDLIYAIERVHTIGDESRKIGKGLAIFKSTILVDIEGVEGSWSGQVATIETKNSTSVAYICLVTIRRDGNTYSS